jgi:hypothetical protein
VRKQGKGENIKTMRWFVVFMFDVGQVQSACSAGDSPPLPSPIGASFQSSSCPSTTAFYEHHKHYCAHYPNLLENIELDSMIEP